MKKFITTLLLLSVCSVLLTSCTLHFKSKELEIDATPPKAQIGNQPQTNSTYHLADADLF